MTETNIDRLPEQERVEAAKATILAMCERLAKRLKSAGYKKAAVYVHVSSEHGNADLCITPTGYPGKTERVKTIVEAEACIDDLIARAPWSAEQIAATLGVAA